MRISVTVIFGDVYKRQDKYHIEKNLKMTWEIKEHNGGKLHYDRKFHEPYRD